MLGRAAKWGVRSPTPGSLQPSAPRRVHRHPTQAPALTSRDPPLPGRARRARLYPFSPPEPEDQPPSFLPGTGGLGTIGPSSPPSRGPSPRDPQQPMAAGVSEAPGGPGGRRRQTHPGKSARKVPRRGPPSPPPAPRWRKEGGPGPAARPCGTHAPPLAALRRLALRRKAGVPGSGATQAEPRSGTFTFFSRPFTSASGNTSRLETDKPANKKAKL